MRILQKRIEPNGNGSIRIKMTQPDDLWHIYNVLSRSDIVKALTLRKIKQQSKTGSVVAHKKKITLFIRVKDVQYDPEALHLRVSGICVAQNQYVAMGQHHTLQLLLNIPFMIMKKHWDSLYLQTLQQVSDPSKNCSVAALVMQEGLAHLCYLNNYATIVKSRIETQIPRKRKGASGHPKGLEKFFNKCLLAIGEHVNFQVIRCLLIASPGFVKQQFSSYLEGQKPRWYNPDQIVYAHSSSGEKQALLETLNNPVVKARLSDVSITQDLEILDEFFRVLGTDPSKAVYSMKDVKTANNSQSIETLIVSDKTLRKKNARERQNLVELIGFVRANGGKIHIISSAHVAGERLEQLSGIAALLRFPVYDLESEESEESEEEEFEVEEEEVKLDPDDLMEDLVND